MKNKFFKFGKPMLSIMVAVAILAASLFVTVPGINFSADAATVTDTWDGTMATGFASGSGTKDDPYIIATAEQLAYAALGDPTVSINKYFKVIDNATFDLNGMVGITLDSTVGDVMTAATNKNWRPATDCPQTFAGYFDGNGVVVYNMCSSGYGYSGLFPRAYNNTSDKTAWVKNVTLLNSRSNGYHNAGGIVGLYDAKDTSRTLTVENCKVLNCWISDNNNANAACQRTSGIIVGNVAHNNSTIKNCFASGNVTSATEISGGIVGNTSLYCPGVSIQNCIVIGSSAYPVVTGSNQKINKHLDVAGTYSGVYTDQNVDAKFGASQIKKVSETDMKGAAAKIAMPDLDWNVWIAFEGELPDYRSNHTLALEQKDNATHNIKCTDCGKAMAETHTFVENATGTMGTCACGFETAIKDRRTDVWDGSFDSNFAAGSGTKADPYIVKTAEQMAYVALKTTPEESKGKYYKVAPNMVFNMNGLSGITLDSTAEEVKNAAEGKDWVNDNKTFAGNFDGNGVVIYNLRSSNGRGNGYAGLFPHITTDNAETTVTIKNITIIASRFMGYHASGAIVGNAHCTKGKQSLVIENCAVKNCYIGDNDNTNVNCQRTAGAITGNCGNNVMTINNCLAVDNILDGTDLNGGFLGNSGAYGDLSQISNSVIIGSSAYTTAVSGNRQPNDNAVNAKCFKNVYTDQVVNGYAEDQIKMLSIGDMSGVNAVQKMQGLDFGKYWFANGGLIELLVSHNIAKGAVNPDDNYAGHTASCKVCGLASAVVINHVYDADYTCTVCDFKCDHNNDDYITTVQVKLDCVTAKQTKTECACGFAESVEHEKPSGHKFIKVDAVEAQCAKTGNIEHWMCETCGKLFLTDDIWASMDNAVTADGVTIPATEAHTELKDSEGNIVYQMNFNKHWTVCSVCAKTIKTFDHEPVYKIVDDKVHSAECSVCFYETVDSEDHILGQDDNVCDKCNWTCDHKDTLVAVSAATADCENDGYSFDHYLCTKCNVRFTDAGATQKVAAADVVINKLGHTYKDADNDGAPDCEFSRDNHWYHCETCNTDVFEAHKYDDTSADGSTGKCACGYEGTVNERSEDTWDGTFDSNFASGSGTKADPYIIKTAEQFAYVVLQMPAKESANKYFKVANCKVFNLSGMVGVTQDSTAKEVRTATIDKNWTSGNDNGTAYFAGHFDGNGLIVYNVYSKGAYAGLFPHITTNNSVLLTASIKNVTVVASRFVGYHYAGGIVGMVNASTSSQFFDIDNCVVKNCYVGDGGDTNPAPSRTAGAILGSVTHNKTTLSNCFAADNIVDASVVSGGLIASCSDYTVGVKITNSVIIGTKAYPELNPQMANSGKTVAAKLLIPSAYSNVYTDQSVSGFGKDQIRSLSLDAMSGAKATQNMKLDFGKYWFANDGLVDMLVCHNVKGSVNASDNYAGHNAYCSDCGIESINVLDHTYDNDYTCTLCGFKCDHKNDKYITVSEFKDNDCIVPKNTKRQCACGYAEQTDHSTAAGHKLEKTEAKAPTCAQNGNIEYWTCENCECIFATNDKMASYDDALTDAQVTLRATGLHEAVTDSNGKEIYSMDYESHWTTCKVCNAKLFRVEHVVKYTDDGASSHDGTCSVCLYEAAENEAHTFMVDGNKCRECKWVCSHDNSIEAVKVAAATCSAEGVSADHYRCKVCDVRFSDDQATVEIAKESVTIKKLGHEHIDLDQNGTPVHEFNETHHWYNCKVCGKGDYAEHTLSIDEESYEGTYKWCDDETGYGCNYSEFDYFILDEENKIQITAPTNAFTKDVVTDIFTITKEDLIYSDIKAVFDKTGQKYSVFYEISPSQTIAEGNKATIITEVMSDLGLDASLYFVNLENGTLEKMPTRTETIYLDKAGNLIDINDSEDKKKVAKPINIATVSVDKFGYFIMTSAEAVVSDDNADGNTNDQGYDNSITSPATGDDAIFASTIIAILASVTVLFVRKAKI